MEKAQTVKLKSGALTAVFVVIALVITGCASKRVARQPSSAGEEVFQKFAQAIEEKSAQTDPALFRTEMTAFLNENSENLSISKINKLEDLNAMSEQEQRKLVDELASNAALRAKFELSDDAVNVARARAVEDSETTAVHTLSVPDLKGSNVAESVSFPGLSADLRAGATRMVTQNAEIESMTGVAVLGKGCSGLTEAEPIHNLEKIVQGVEDDVTAGTIKTDRQIAGKVDEEISEVTGADKNIAHTRRCRLAQPRSDSGCEVLSGAMYTGCAE